MLVLGQREQQVRLDRLVQLVNPDHLVSLDLLDQRDFRVQRGPLVRLEQQALVVHRASPVQQDQMAARGLLAQRGLQLLVGLQETRERLGHLDQLEVQDLSDQQGRWVRLGHLELLEQLVTRVILDGQDLREIQVPVEIPEQLEYRGVLDQLGQLGQLESQDHLELLEILEQLVVQDPQDRQFQERGSRVLPDFQVEQVQQE